ncbi:peptidylprolyl isomerase [Floccifex sp.]|uniref:peptidylprolyl isomerase n=1 Tax=Floccifex sp. TaxID=2815810 RepID=UPI002A749D38|nr:peptidylprolyl isomerase [Floccifex sp.]MDY2959145.1 peptidylprolyl isomerase [Floccifex sp.]
MEKMIQDAKNKKREAVLALYEQTKGKVYFFCDFLLEDKTKTDFVFEEVYDEIWKIFFQKNIQTIQEFNDLCLKSTIRICENKLSLNAQKWKDAKPSVEETIEILDMKEDIPFEQINEQLNSFNLETRFIIKSYLYSNFSIRQLADALSFDELVLEDYIQYCFQSNKDMKHYKFNCLKQNKNPYQPIDAKCKDKIEAFTHKEPSKKKWLLIPILLVVLVCGYLLFKPAPTYFADIKIKDYGTIVVQLDSEQAPETVENFVDLAESGFYDGLTFHRIIDGFMMQGGDPNGNGTGGSDKTIKGEFSANGVDNELSHTRGTISMARSSAYDSASSQFFIVQSDSTFLDGQYAAFGTVLSGMDIVDEICEQAQPTDDNGTIEASEQPVIESITIRTE